MDYLKLFSGKVLITFTCAIGFLMVVHACCLLIIKKADSMTFDNVYTILNTILLIISNIITFYFTKSGNKKG